MFADKLVDLLGERLTNNKKESTNTSSLVKADRVIGLYFSAHWCPPCRGFTPKLAEFYNKFKQSEKRDRLEIVFVSSDNDQECFDEYMSEQPWPALPYDERERKAKLSKKFKVQGIPTLVLIDSQTANIITSSGRSNVMEDPEANNFPWIPPSFEEIFGKSFVNNKEEQVSIDDLKGKVLGIYFSAHWCPPCKAFTPVLVDTYNKLREVGTSFEVVFCTSDRSAEAFSQYFSSMPWLAVPFSDEARRKALSKYFNISGIPTLIIMDENNAVITMEGRSMVGSDPDGKDFPWHPKPVNDLTQVHAGKLNEETCVLLITDGSAEDVSEARSTLLAIAERSIQEAKDKGEDQPFHFFVGGEDDFVDSVRDFCRLDDRVPILLILDVPSQKLYVSDQENITSEVVKKFLDDYQSGSLPPKKLPSS